MKRIGIAALGVAFALVAGAGIVRAQENGSVKLAYKWKPGQLFKYRLTGGGTFTMNLGGLPVPAGAPGAPPAGGIPMDMKMTMEAWQRVKEVAPDGSATVTQQLQAMNMTNTVMGMNVVLKLEDGKMSMTMNGQPFPLQPGGQGADMAALMSKGVDIRLTPRGQMIELTGAAREAVARMFQGSNISAMFGGGTLGAGMLIMPESPVKPGESWTDKQLLRVPVQGGLGGPGGAQAQLMQVDYSVENTCSRIEGDGDKRTAVIATKAKATIPETKLEFQADPKNAGAAGLPVTIRSFTQNINGTVNFDLAAGYIRSGDYTVDMGMKMDLPFAPPGGAADGAKPQVAMDGKMTMKVALLPESKLEVNLKPQ
jgi:hypothetical protein